MELTNLQTSLLNWVKKARHQDKKRLQPVLEKVVVDKEKVYACDGYRIHQVVFNGEVIQSGYYQPNLKEEENEILGKREDNEKNYPDLSRFFSIEPKPYERKVTLFINPKFLKEAIEKMQDRIEIKIIYSGRDRHVMHPIKITGVVKEPKTKTEYELTAIVMPMSPY